MRTVYWFFIGTFSFFFVASLSSDLGQNVSEHTTIIIAIAADYIETLLNHIGNF